MLMSNLSKFDNKETPTRELLLKGKALYSSPPHSDRSFCKNGKKYSFSVKSS